MKDKLGVPLFIFYFAVRILLFFLIFVVFIKILGMEILNYWGFLLFYFLRNIVSSLAQSIFNSEIVSEMIADDVVDEARKKGKKARMGIKHFLIIVVKESLRFVVIFFVTKLSLKFLTFGSVNYENFNVFLFSLILTLMPFVLEILSTSTKVDEIARNKKQFEYLQLFTWISNGETEKEQLVTEVFKENMEKVRERIEKIDDEKLEKNKKEQEKNLYKEEIDKKILGEVQMDKEYYLKNKEEIIKNIMGETEYIANLIVFFAIDRDSYAPMKEEILKKKKIN